MGSPRRYLEETISAVKAALLKARFTKPAADGCRRLASGELRRISEEFGVGYFTVFEVSRNETYANIKPHLPNRP